ncbi:DNA cytosine methyltransferase [Lysinibacillus louembei]|uniref:Cytosine-specific methyltransferase n=1 Tax=Lysinibacillus louembei TaxID=1470088 RepID=A0ABZ0RZE7_9BACI|nr:DNA cytosine methyltransferase [Lysinibacillus louembei]WPK12260.1 DNA cytosine methyltransferase [Lysinibacillus louembei]
MKFLDLFAGIGGFRLGLEAAGHECVGYVEIDKFARKSYEAIHDTKGEWTAHDITTVTDDDIRKLRDRGSIEIICGGFPCQAFSIAGKRKGFEDTRGTLFFDIARFANILRPRYLFLENVVGLLNHNGGDTFEVILRTLDELGYDAEWQVLNSKNFGVPQNRERVFIIGHSRNASTRKIFPVGGTSTTTNNIEILAHHSGITETLDTGGGGGHYTVTMNRNEIKGITDTSHSLMARDYKGIGNQDMAAVVIPGRGVMIKEATKQGYDVAHEGDSINLAVPSSQTRRGRVGKGIANTLDTSCNQGVLDTLPADKKIPGTIGHHPIGKKFEFDGYKGDIAPCLLASDYKAPKTTLTGDMRIRKLTPRECWRLQGFPDWAFDRAREVNSDSQLYKQAGNSVTVNVIAAIAKELY